MIQVNTYGDDREHVSEGHVGDEHEEDAADVSHHRWGYAILVEIEVNETKHNGEELYVREKEKGKES